MTDEHEQEIVLRVNGEERSMQVAVRLTLVDLLRDRPGGMSPEETEARYKYERGVYGPIALKAGVVEQ